MFLERMFFQNVLFCLKTAPSKVAWQNKVDCGKLHGGQVVTKFVSAVLYNIFVS